MGPHPTLARESSKAVPSHSILESFSRPSRVTPRQKERMLVQVKKEISCGAREESAPARLFALDCNRTAKVVVVFLNFLSSRHRIYSEEEGVNSARTSPSRLPAPSKRSRQRNFRHLPDLPQDVFLQREPPDRPPATARSRLDRSNAEQRYFLSQAITDALPLFAQRRPDPRPPALLLA